MRGAVEIAALAAAGLVPVVAYLAIGRALLDACFPSLAKEHDSGFGLACAYALGTGAASLAFLGLRALDVGVSLPLALATGAAASWQLWRGRPVFGFPRLRRPVRAHERVDAVSVALGALLVLAALGPETWWDGFEFHLPLASAWTEGPIRALPGVIHAEFRAGVDLLYLPAVAWGEGDAAAAVTAGFAVAIALLIRSEATRRAGETAAALAAVFWLLTPFVLKNALSTYVDLGAGLYGALALLCLDRWNRGGAPTLLGLAAALLAFAANAKLHAAVLGLVAALLLLLGGRFPGVATCLRCAALSLALALPWLVKSWATSGNPLFPLFPEVLGAGPTTPDWLALGRFRLTTDLPAQRSVTGFLHYLMSLSFGRNPHFSGQLGALPLALAPLALGRLPRPTALLTLLCGVLVVGLYVAMPALRYGTPLLPLLAVATAVGGARLAASGRGPRLVLLSCLALLALHHAAQLVVVTAPRLVALRAPQAYERARFPDQDALREVVARAPGPVAIPKGAVSWMPRPVYVLEWMVNAEIFFDEVAGRRTPPDEVLALLRRRGIVAVALDVPAERRRPDLTGHPTTDHWIRRGEARIRPDPEPPAARRGRVWVLLDLRPE